MSPIFQYSHHLTNHLLSARKVFLNTIFALLISLYSSAFAQKEQQSELKNIQSEIKSLDSKISQTEREIGNEKQKVQDLEKSISSTEAQYQTLQAKINVLNEDISTLSQTVDSERKKVESQLAALKKMIITSYKESDAPLMKMLLNQNDPELMDRYQQYYQYYSKSQAERITTQRAEIESYLEAKNKLISQQDALDQAKKDQAALSAKLAEQKKEREKNIVQLDSSLSQDANKLNRLQLDEQRLKKLVKELQLAAKRKAIAEKKAAEEKARKAAAERERLAKLRQQQQSNNNTGTVNNPSVASNYPNDADKEIIIPKEPPRQEPRTSNAGLGKLKGQLPYPLQGQVVAQFGSPKQGSGLSWNGMMIKANRGTPVQAVADGDVVFSDWFKGFGQMVVVDHGQGYMSLYSHNSQMAKRVGAKVRQRDVIAYAGNSGGLAYDGLYFEIRYNGQPVNPASWLR